MYLKIKKVYLILEKFGGRFADPFQKSPAKVQSLRWIGKHWQVETSRALTGIVNHHSFSIYLSPI